MVLSRGAAGAPSTSRVADAVRLQRLAVGLKISPRSSVGQVGSRRRHERHLLVLSAASGLHVDLVRRLSLEDVEHEGAHWFGLTRSFHLSLGLAIHGRQFDSDRGDGVDRP